MMKSFFKKLAFVMALAMVVTLAAPAGSAFAASALRVVDADKNVCTTYELAVGETEDFAFWDAKNWTNYTWAWESSDPEVASVNKGGVVEGLTDGVATITVTGSLDGEVVYSGEVVVTVGEGEVEEEVVNTYTVKQNNHKKVTLTFDEAVEFTADDVVVSKMFDGEEVFWPIQNVKIDGNKITYETYINYEDGEEYVVRVGADDEGTLYTTSIGEVIQVKLTYGTNKDAQGYIVYPGKAYSNGEDGDDLTVYLNVQLLNKYGVDVTNYYTVDDVVYEMTEDNEDIMLDNYSGEMVFYKVGVPAVVTATYTFYDEEGEQHEVSSPATPIVSAKAPAYGIKSVDGWAIVKDSVTNYYDINWNNHEIAAEDDAINSDGKNGTDNYKIVAKFTDTNGNQYITDGRFSNLPYNLYDATDSSYDFADKGNYVTFSSSNINKLLVGEDGDLTTSDKTKVAVILTLHNYESEKDDFFVKNVSAFQVNVNAKRKVSSVVLKANSVTVITDAFDSDFTKKTVEAYVYDQYNTKWYENVTLSFSTTVDGAPALGNATYYAGDKATFVVNGAQYATVNKQTVAYTVKENEKGNTTTLKVVVKNPKLDDGSIKETSYSLVAKSVDMKSNWWDGSDDKTTDISYYRLSNSVEVGYRSDVSLIASAGALVIPEGTALKGDQYVVIYDAKGRVVEPVADATAAALKIAAGKAAVVENESGSYTLHVANLADDDRMDYAPTGTYTVKVLEIRDFNKDVAVFKTKYEKSFDVTNSNSDVTFRKQEKVDVTVSIDNKYFNHSTKDEYEYEDRVAAAIKQAVKNAFSVNIDGSKWSYATSNILSVDYKINAGQDSVIVRSVTFKVPLATKNGFYEYELKVNRAFDLTLVPVDPENVEKEPAAN